MAQFLAQFADMAFDHILFDLVVEQSINGVEYLGLGDALSLMRHQIFEDATFAARQRKADAFHFGIAAVKIDPHFANHLAIDLRFLAATNGADARHDFAHMNRLAHDIVDAGGKQIQGLLQRLRIIERNDWNMATFANHFGKDVALAAIANEEGFHRQQVGLADACNPFLEFVGTQTRGGDALPVETRSIAALNDFALIDDDEHLIPQSLGSFPDRLARSWASRR